IPGFISVSGTSEGPGFLGMAYAPFTVQNPGAPPQNISPPGDLGQGYQLDERMKRRYNMFIELENTFLSQKRGDAAKSHADIYKKAFALTYSPVKAVFNLDIDTNAQPMNPKLRDEYGRNGFGNGCLLARKLVEANVPCIEVDLGGWD